MINENFMLEEDLEEDLEYDDIVTCVMESLKANAVDYCYSRKDMKAIIARAKKIKARSFVYRELLEKDGSLDYYKIIPAKFYMITEKGEQQKVKNYYCDYNSIPFEYKCTILKKKHDFVLKNYHETIEKRKN